MGMDKLNLQEKFEKDQEKKVLNEVEKNKKSDPIEDNDIHVIGGGDPNLSPDAGKPMI